MQIINQSREHTKMEIYSLTQDCEIKSMKTLEEEPFKVNSWIIYKDIDKDGKEIELLSMSTNLGVYAAQSKTFIESFLNINELFGNEPYMLQVVHAKSKADRDYINCRAVPVQ